MTKSFYSLEISAPAPIHTSEVYNSTTVEDLRKFAHECVTGTLPYYDEQDQSPVGFFHAAGMDIRLWIIQRGVVRGVRDSRAYFAVVLRDGRTITYDDRDAVCAVDESQVIRCSVDDEELVRGLPPLEPPLLEEGEEVEFTLSPGIEECTEYLSGTTFGYNADYG